MTPLPIRWVLVHDPEEQLATKAYFSTDSSYAPERIVESLRSRAAGRGGSSND